MGFADPAGSSATVLVQRDVNRGDPSASVEPEKEIAGEGVRGGQRRASATSFPAPKTGQARSRGGAVARHGLGSQSWTRFSTPWRQGQRRTKPSSLRTRNVSLRGRP